MRRIHSFLTLCLLLGILHETYGQHNFLSKTQRDIESYFAQRADFLKKVDTISAVSILLTFRPSYQYPFYTYEVNFKTDSCISFALVSKNEEVLQAYLDLLSITGENIDSKSSAENVTYFVRTPELNYYYSITQPYYNSDVLSRRKLFYIMVSAESNR